LRGDGPNSRGRGGIEGRAGGSGPAVPGAGADAERFEVYLNGVELANGYHELTDHQEQKRRFMAEAQGRDIDQRLLQAMSSGMPDCAGVAMGLDRILMVLSNLRLIDEVLSFSWERA